MANKLTTAGYIQKRLRDSGYHVDKLYSDYGNHDPRAWTLIIDPGGCSVFFTCYINDPFVGETFFELFDGNQYIPGRFKIQTSSLEVIVEQLVKFGILGKKPTNVLQQQ